MLNVSIFNKIKFLEHNFYWQFLFLKTSKVTLTLKDKISFLKIKNWVTLF